MKEKYLGEEIIGSFFPFSLLFLPYKFSLSLRKAFSDEDKQWLNEKPMLGFADRGFWGNDLLGQRR